MFIMTACGDKGSSEDPSATPSEVQDVESAPISQIGRTYRVNSVDDIEFVWASQDKKEETLANAHVSSEEELKAGYINFVGITFTSEEKLAYSFGGGSDNDIYYTISELGVVTFYWDATDFASKTAYTDDYYGFEHKFNETKTEILLTTVASFGMAKLTLHVQPEV